LKTVHIVVGVLAIVGWCVVGLFGAWCWWRIRPNVWFWRLLRVAQLLLIVQVALGGVLVLIGYKPPGLHVLYGVLPLLVSLIGEQLRIGSAQMVLDARGLESAQAVGALPEAEQHGVVVAIVRREVGVMTLAAIVIVILLLRAAMTAG
jgi:hypothetical protein